MNNKVISRWLCQKWGLEKKISYEIKNNIFFFNVELTENNTFNDVFCNRIFPQYCFLPIFKNDWIFLNHGLCFLWKIFSTILLLPILKVCKKSSDIPIIKKFFFVHRRPKVSPVGIVLRAERWFFSTSAVKFQICFNFPRN